MRDKNLPEIQLSFKKIYPDFNSSFIKGMINAKAGVYYPDDNIIVLSYGDFTKGLLKKYGRTIEKQTCKTISHEVMHWILFNDLNIKACGKFDNIAKKLNDYGVY